MFYLRNNTAVVEFLRNFEFHNWHVMRGGPMLPDSISEEKLEIDWKMEDLQAGAFWCRLLMTPEQPAPERTVLGKVHYQKKN